MRQRTPATRCARRVLVALAASLLVLLAPGVASAAPPLEVADRVTDLAGALGTGGPAVERAVAELEASTGVELYAVLVQTFQDDADQDWAERTARRSGLDETDVLLAVAVKDDGSYEYSWWSGEDFPLDDDEIAAIVTADVEPAMDVGDRARGVTAFADQLRSEMTAAGLDTDMFEPPDWTRTTTAAVLGGGAAVLLVGHLLSRRGSAASAG
jgi:uncharacterized membrane protein YgcG